MLSGKTLIDYTSLLSPQDFRKNDKIILSYFKLKFKGPNFRFNKINKIKYYFITEIC